MSRWQQEMDDDSGESANSECREKGVPHSRRNRSNSEMMRNVPCKYFVESRGFCELQPHCPYNHSRLLLENPALFLYDEDETSTKGLANRGELLPRVSTSASAGAPTNRPQIHFVSDDDSGDELDIPYQAGTRHSSKKQKGKTDGGHKDRKYAALDERQEETFGRKSRWEFLCEDDDEEINNRRESGTPFSSASFGRGSRETTEHIARQQAYVPCENFLDGHCDLGPRCPYNHDVETLREIFPHRRVFQPNNTTNHSALRNVGVTARLNSNRSPFSSTAAVARPSTIGFEDTQPPRGSWARGAPATDRKAKNGGRASGKEKEQHRGGFNSSDVSSYRFDRPSQPSTPTTHTSSSVLAANRRPNLPSFTGSHRAPQSRGPTLSIGGGATPLQRGVGALDTPISATQLLFESAMSPTRRQGQGVSVTTPVTPNYLLRLSQSGGNFGTRDRSFFGDGPPGPLGFVRGERYVSPALYEFSGRLPPASGQVPLQRGSSIDPDNMTYEELVELGERIGDVDIGMKSADFGRIPTKVYQKPKLRSAKGEEKEEEKDEEECAICCDAFQSGDVFIELPCTHIFHRDCLKQWFAQKPLCPVCKTEFRTTNK